MSTAFTFPTPLQQAAEELSRCNLSPETVVVLHGLGLDVSDRLDCLLDEVCREHELVRAKLLARSKDRGLARVRRQFARLAHELGYSNVAIARKLQRGQPMVHFYIHGRERRKKVEVAA